MHPSSRQCTNTISHSMEHNYSSMAPLRVAPPCSLVFLPAGLTIITLATSTCWYSALSRLQYPSVNSVVEWNPFIYLSQCIIRKDFFCFELEYSIVHVWTVHCLVSSLSCDIDLPDKLCAITVSISWAQLTHCFSDTTGRDSEAQQQRLWPDSLV